MFELGIITDEVTQSLDEAIEFATKHQLSFLEIRSLNDKPFHKLSIDEINNIKEKCEMAGLKVAAISSPTFKCDYDNEEDILANIEIFRTCAKYAKILGAKIIRAFDFWNAGVETSKRAEKFLPIIEICKEYDVICALEYDPSVHSSTPAKIAETLKAISSPYVKALYDPGNGIFSEPENKPFPDGYNHLKENIVHIHIKDAIIEEGKAVAVKVGTGLVDYISLFKELKNCGYSGKIALETHYRLTSELSEEQLNRPGGAAFSDGGRPASEESIIALKALINKI